MCFVWYSSDIRQWYISGFDRQACPLTATAHARCTRLHPLAFQNAKLRTNMCATGLWFLSIVCFGRIFLALKLGLTFPSIPSLLSVLKRGPCVYPCVKICWVLCTQVTQRTGRSNSVRKRLMLHSDVALCLSCQEIPLKWFCTFCLPKLCALTPGYAFLLIDNKSRQVEYVCNSE